MIKNASWERTLCTYRNGQIFKILSLERSCARTTPLVLLVCPSIICKVFRHTWDYLSLSLTLSPSHTVSPTLALSLSLTFLAPHFLSLYPIRSFSHSLTLSAALTLALTLRRLCCTAQLVDTCGVGLLCLDKASADPEAGASRVGAADPMGIGVLCFGNLWRCEMWGTLRNRRLGSLRICQSPPDHVIAQSLPGAAPR